MLLAALAVVEADVFFKLGATEQEGQQHDTQNINFAGGIYAYHSLELLLVVATQLLALLA